MQKKDKQRGKQCQSQQRENKVCRKYMQMAIMETHMQQHTIKFVPELISLHKGTQTGTDAQIYLSGVHAPLSSCIIHISGGLFGSAVVRQHAPGSPQSPRGPCSLNVPLGPIRKPHMHTI